jgi:Bacterial archaeo-eukaryotic release factor family 10
MGRSNHRIALQLPPRVDLVRWDERPFASPLVDVRDRRRATGLVLVSGNQVRLLHWEGGLVEEPERSLYELELGDRRDYSAYAMANPARAQQTATNDAAYEARVEERRERFFEDAARAVAARLSELGWERLVMAAEGQVASSFAGALPAELRQCLVTAVELNLNGATPAIVAAALEDPLEAAWEEEARERAAAALEADQAGGRGAAGPAAVLEALAAGRVEWLVLDPLACLEIAGLGPTARHALNGAAPEGVAERAVELAVAGGAAVSALPIASSPALASAGGMVARLRY